MEVLEAGYSYALMRFLSCVVTLHVHHFYRLRPFDIGLCICRGPGFTTIFNSPRTPLASWRLNESSASSFSTIHVSFSVHIINPMHYTPPFLIGPCSRVERYWTTPRLRVSVSVFDGLLSIILILLQLLWTLRFAFPSRVLFWHEHVWRRCVRRIARGCLDIPYKYII
jgi:hypothetical protein